MLHARHLVLYEIFVGRPAFDGTTRADLERRAATAPLNPSSDVDGLAPNVDSAILGCLEADPARRPASAKAVGEALAVSDAPAVVSAVDSNRLLIYPFEARGPSESTDFIGQSLAEALAINLAMVSKFSVLPVPRGESAGPGAAADLARAGRQQGAGHVIHGSLRREGRKVELTVFLIDTADGRIVGGAQESLEEVDLTTIAASAACEVAAKLGGSVAGQYEPIKSIKLDAEMATIPEVLAMLGAFRCGDFRAAVANAKQVLQHCPESPDAHALHVNAMYEAWRPEPSSKNREALDQALVRLRAVDPHSPYLDMFYGQLAYEGDGRPRAAIAAFTRVLERDDLSPTCRAWVLRNRAQPLQKIGRTEEATEDLKMAVKFAPVEPWNFYALSNTLCWSRRFEEALIEARRAVAFEPWDYRHHLVVAQALAGLARWDEGLVHANKAYDGSRAQDAGGLRAVCLQGAGLAEDARTAAEEAAGLTESADGMVHLARYREMAGEPEQALRHLERAVEIGLANLDFVEDFPSLADDERFRRIVDGVRERLESV
jgi:TolB-like protein